MSEPMTQDEIREGLAAIEAAYEEVFALCKGEHAKGGRRFRMTVPVEDTDSDIVLVRALDAGKRALVAVGAALDSRRNR